MKTSRFFGIVAAVALSLGATACKKEEASPEPKVNDDKKAAPATAETPAPTASLTDEERAKTYQACWAAFNTRDWARLEACYADGAQIHLPNGLSLGGKGGRTAVPKAFAAAFPDLVGELQVVLVSGNNIASLALLKGTHTGSLAMPGMPEIPPTNKRIGMLVVHTGELDDQGKAVREWHFFDTGTMLGQLGLSPAPGRPVMDKGIVEAPQVVVAKDDEAERKHVELFERSTRAFNSRDTATLSGDFAPDAVWWEAALPMDMNPKQMVAGLEQFWKGFSDMRATMTHTWAAGDFTVGAGMMTGTNDGDLPMMKLAKTGKQISLPFVELFQWDGDKIKRAWIVYDSGTMASQLGMPPPAAKPGDKAAKPAK
jgi:predicted ester cyclase